MSVTLFIEATDLSPEIDFNLSEKKFVIRGRSMPENSEKFYNPILSWMQENLAFQFLEATFDVALEYYNTGSFIRLMALFNLLEELNKKDNKFRVRWIVEEGDEDNVADGESFREVIRVPFEIIEV
ncbi:MAG: DUF1987 domain-containing protein [Flavobacteriales bacterium]|nr:DUF1987 domain-containing protein [Flavobacteriales bacterium]